MLAGTLNSELPWGLLLVSDRDSDHQVPEFSRDRLNPEPFIHKDDAVVVRVIHGQDGPMSARIWVGEEELNRRGAVELGTCTLAIPSGLLVVGDVLEEQTIEVSLPAGSYLIQINGDNAVEPEEIDLVLAPTPG